MLMPRTKNEKIFYNLMYPGLHEKLASLACWVLMNFFQEEHNNGPMIITSAYRPGNSGVHGQVPCRGLDLRVYNVNDPQGLVDEVNAAWSYDKTRPDLNCALFHDVGLGEHIHLQVHDNTEFVGG